MKSQDSDRGPCSTCGRINTNSETLRYLGGVGLAERRRPVESPGGKLAVRIVIVLRRQGELLQVVAATHPPRRPAGRLDRRQQQGDENADDGNHHQQFDQRKRLARAHGRLLTRSAATQRLRLP